MSTKDQNVGTTNGEESRPLIVGGGQNPMALKSNLAKPRVEDNNGQPISSATSPPKQIAFRTASHTSPAAAAAAAANAEVCNLSQCACGQKKIQFFLSFFQNKPITSLE